MKPGQIIHTFTAKDGRKVVLRTPRWEDLDGLTELINSLIEAEAEISLEKKLSREQEIDWLSGVFARMEKGQTLCVVAEVDDRVVGSSSIWPKDLAKSKHVGSMGIIIKEGYQNVGIGTEIMKTLIEQARLMGFKVANLTVFETNKRAIHVYEKVGFKEVGRIPKGLLHRGRLIDEIMMAHVLEEEKH